VPTKIKQPNPVLRRIREYERHESREEFARAVLSKASELGESGLACDARLVGRWEDGDVSRPRPIYQRVLSVLLNRPFEELGFGGCAIALPSPRQNAADLPSETISLRMDEEGQVWAEMNRRSFVVGSVAALLQAGGVPQAGTGAVASPPSPCNDPFQFATAVQGMWPGLRLCRPVPDYGVDWTMLLPGGRAFEGSTTAVQVHAADARDGRLQVRTPDPRRWAEFAQGRGRGLMVAAETSGEQPRFFALDAREARRNVDRGRPVIVPTAYELDDLSYGILWATANLDDGLLADDQDLTASKTELAAYESLTASAVSREAVPGLATVSHMWLGSDFCARHILRHLDGLPEQPVFWTREQRGEEASTWLLFGHKYAYLRKTQERAGGTRLVRAFCVPEDAVRESPRHERILLFLAAALMESCGIEVQLTAEAEFEDVDGFVLGGTRQAIVANWVRSDGMWRVDSTQRTSVLSEYTDAIGYVDDHSVIGAPSPAGRLAALARYLELDLAWLRRRCRELGQHGTTRLVRPRSRLVSSEGLDAACTYVGALPVAG
jgi:hypothetical protein